MDGAAEHDLGEDLQCLLEVQERRQVGLVVRHLSLARRVHLLLELLLLGYDFRVSRQLLLHGALEIHLRHAPALVNVSLDFGDFLQQTRVLKQVALDLFEWHLALRLLVDLDREHSHVLKNVVELLVQVLEDLHHQSLVQLHIRHRYLPTRLQEIIDRTNRTC